MKKTGSGEFRHPIDIIKDEIVDDEMGGQIKTPVVQMSTRAAIWPVSAKETLNSDKMVMAVTHRIRTRFIPNFNPAWRVQLSGRYFSVVSVINPDEACVYLDLMCKEVINVIKLR